MFSLVSSRIMPRTTLDIDAPLLDELKRLRETQGQSIGRIASDLLAEALSGRRPKPARRTFRWNARRMKARVELTDKDALNAVLDGKEGPGGPRR
jgi:hypothetical protein